MDKYLYILYITIYKYGYMSGLENDVLVLPGEKYVT